jgi:hypothetical protein
LVARTVEVVDLDEDTIEEEIVEEAPPVKLTAKQKLLAKQAAEEEAAAAEAEEEELEDFEPDDSEELWEDGPTFGDLKGWKAQYGEENVFVSLINPSLNKYCIWRTLDRHEYRQLVKKLEDTINAGQISETEATMNNEEDIAQICVIYPPYNKNDRKGTSAGFPKLISNDVMEQSGFVEVEVRQL